MNVLEKNLLVLASAGSGKTFCLSDRIIGLIAGGVEPEKIVALTFTRKAAGEFADAILTKLAGAAEDPEKAADLGRSIGAMDADFSALLEKVIRKLPRLTLGTMDGFFARVVKGFQYELGVTGGRFDLLEGEAGESLRDGLMENLLDGELDAETEEEFATVFRRATAGNEGTRVLEELRKFVATWHQLFVSPNASEWGPASLAGLDVSAWEKQKHDLIEQVRRDWPNVPDRKKRHDTAFEPMLRALREHTVSSGLLDKATGLVPKILEAAREGSGNLSISYYQPLVITGLAAEALRNLVELAARCELAAALSRTRGIHGVIGSYDALVERELRAKGRLGFDDVKRLMGAWMKGEDARLRREAVDFRLDANYSHWLLDEFQDTSREEWSGLLPLIDEGITDDESTVFIVGDRKQAIYAWRGGEVGLFDEVIENYRGGLSVETMEESWRSCPQVLELVNRVCGDAKTMAHLFGPAAERWEWKDHVSAPPLALPEKAGYSRVEIVSKDEDKTERVIELLRELGIGKKQLSCGVLVETNKHVGEWADALRAEGFQVVEEGAREPGKDHPVGVMIWQLLRWMADPSDDFARHTVMMSPLAPVLAERFGEAWQSAWEKLGGLASEKGFAGMLGELVAPLQGEWSEFGKRRAADLLNALEQLDREGIVTAREAADRIERMKISQSPGVAAVQVMTVHKSKGLGFDVVILPDVATNKVPDLTHFKTIVGEDWITSAPAAWARAMIPEISSAEAKWAEQQTYEAFCKLYVAMTRAKRGLYVFLDTPSKSASEDKASLANWLMVSLGLDAEGGLFEYGEPAWAASVKLIKAKQETELARLGEAVAKRSRSTPSGEKSRAKTVVTGTKEGRRFGTDIHAAFESIGWLNEDALPAFHENVRRTMEAVLSVRAVADLFTKNDRPISLFREQRVEAVMDGRWISGVIDRLHVHHDKNGEAYLVEIIDFKTDRVDSGEDLLARYAEQMKAYEKAMAAIYPQAEVKSILVSTALKILV